MRNLEHSPLVYPHVEQASLPIRGLARAMSALFRSALMLRNLAYDRQWISGRSLPGRVISVGNVAVGGTGKTPTVMALVSYLLKMDKKPAILTRGYGSGLAKKDWVLLRAGELVGGTCTPVQLPDEARLQSAAFPEIPVIAGPARYTAATDFLKQCKDGELPTHWILDDGFQHRAIERDFDLVLVDATNPFGNFHVLPFGMLREPVDALRRADQILLTGAGKIASEVEHVLKKFAPSVPVSHAQHVSLPLALDITNALQFDVTQHLPVLMVAGIARPERLRRDLEIDGVEICNELIPGDHAPVLASELASRIGSARSVVVTSKDYWRNPAVFQSLKIPVFVKNAEINLPESLLTSIL